MAVKSIGAASSPALRDAGRAIVAPRRSIDCRGQRQRQCARPALMAAPGARPGSGSIGPVAATAPTSGLYGREAELDALGGALDRAASGRLAVVLVEGEAGIGKTRLLAEILANADRRGMQIASGRAEELESSRPFGVIAQALGCARSAVDPRRSAIAELLATSGGGHGPVTVSSDPGLQFRAVDALTDLAEELAVRRSLVVGLDDLQWADRSSLLTVGALCRRLADLPAAIIGCFRPSPRVPALTRLLDSLTGAGARYLAVLSLPDRSVSELVAEMAGAEPGPSLLALVAGAAGNPLFVTELLKAIAQDGLLQTASGRAEVAAMTLPPTLGLTILRRLSFLPEETLQTLRSASILGSSFSLTGLSATTDRPALALSLALAEAIRARVLEDDGDRLRFRHDLIRDAIYTDLPRSVRLALHREAGRRLADAGGPALQVAEQFARGAAPGDAAAIGWLTQAAREAAATSPDTAADLLDRAIGLMDPQDPARDSALVERAGSLLLAGRVFEAEADCRRVLERGPDPGSAGQARVCLGRTLLAQGRAEDAVRELEDALGSPVLTEADRAAAWGWVGAAHWALGHLDGAATAAEQARSAAAAAGDHLTTSAAATILALVAEHRGHLEDALQIIDGALRLADQSPGRQGHRYPLHMHRGHILMCLDRLQDAGSSLAAGRRISEEHGNRWALVPCQVLIALNHFVSGEWDDAVAELEAGIELADEAGEPYLLPLGWDIMALIRLHRNDLAGAEQAAAKAVAQLAGTGPSNRIYGAMWAPALLLEAHGDSAEALAAVAGIWDQCVQSGAMIECPVLGPDLVRLAVAAGEISRASEAAAVVADVAAANNVPWLTGAALHCQGLAADDAELLAEAVQSYSRGHRPLQVAQAAEDAGRAMARHGHGDRARGLLDQAVAIYERLEAARDLTRTEATMRQLGIRRGVRGRRGRPSIGWPSLTSTERTVADLVAEGLSNPQIGERLYISRRTVQSHLAHIFTKLDISSRVQLAAEVIRQPAAARDDPKAIK